MESRAKKPRAGDGKTGCGPKLRRRHSAPAGGRPKKARTTPAAPCSVRVWGFYDGYSSQAGVWRDRLKRYDVEVLAHATTCPAAATHVVVSPGTSDLHRLLAKYGLDGGAAAAKYGLDGGATAGGTGCLPVAGGQPGRQRVPCRLVDKKWMENNCKQAHLDELFLAKAKGKPMGEGKIKGKGAASSGGTGGAGGLPVASGQPGRQRLPCRDEDFLWIPAPAPEVGTDEGFDEPMATAVQSEDEATLGTAGPATAAAVAGADAHTQHPHISYVSARYRRRVRGGAQA